MSNYFFIFFVILLSLQRLFELKKSENNRRWLIAQGGREHGAEHFPFMAMLHAFWLIAMVAEVWFLQRIFIAPVAIIAGVIFLLGQLFRILAMRDLQERWCARIITLPGKAPVTTPLFRYLRHPNYIGVVLEIAAAPMIHMAYLSATIFTILNALLLWVRIRSEEQALNHDNNYWASFAAIKKSGQ